MTTPTTPTAAKLENSYGPEVLSQHALSHSHPEASPYQETHYSPQLDQPGYVTKYEQPPPTPAKRSTISVALLVFAVTALVIGGSLGGALGTKLSSCEDKLSDARKIAQQATTWPASPSTTSSSSPRPSSTATPSVLREYSVEPAAKVETLKVDCPGLNKQQITTHTGDKYSFTCGFDIASGAEAVGGGVVADIIGVIAYSVADCAAACSEFTRRANQWDTGTQCSSFTFGLDMKKVTQDVGGNCWLKNGTIKNNSEMVLSQVAVSGKMV